MSGPTKEQIITRVGRNWFETLDRSSQEAILNSHYETYKRGWADCEAEKDKRIAELEAQVPKWRDTVYDPPEQGQQVLIDWDGPVREMIVCRYCGLADQGFFDECGNWLNAGMAKKWCELPSPPKESEQGG